MTCTWSSNGSFLEIPINHDIYWLSKKMLTSGAAELICALRSLSFVCLTLFEEVVFLRHWFASVSCLRKAWHFLWCCVRPLEDKALNCSGQCLQGNINHMESTKKNERNMAVLSFRWLWGSSIAIEGAGSDSGRQAWSCAWIIVSSESHKYYYSPPLPLVLVMHGLGSAFEDSGLSNLKPAAWWQSNGSDSDVG